MSSPFATTNSAKAFHPDVVGLAPQDVIPEALVIQTSTKAGNVEGDEPAVRVPFVEIDEADVGFVPDGDDIDEVEPDSSEVLIHTGKVAVLTRISREQWVSGSAASMLSDAVRRALILKANAAYLAQVAPTPPGG